MFGERVCVNVLCIFRANRGTLLVRRKGFVEETIIPSRASNL